jgi:amidase
MIEGQSIKSISTEIKSQRLKSEDVVNFYLDKINKYNKDLNAIISLRDESEVLSEAREKDQLIKNKSQIGLLHGLPLAVKDTVDVTKLPTSYGCMEYKNNFPAEDSIITER